MPATFDGMTRGVRPFLNTDYAERDCASLNRNCAAMSPQPAPDRSRGMSLKRPIARPPKSGSVRDGRSVPLRDQTANVHSIRVMTVLGLESSRIPMKNREFLLDALTWPLKLIDQWSRRVSNTS